MSSNAISLRQALLSKDPHLRAQAIASFASPFNIHIKIIALQSALLLGASASGDSRIPSQDINRALCHLSDHVVDDTLLIDEMDALLSAVYHWADIYCAESEVKAAREVLCGAMWHAQGNDISEFSLGLVA